MALSWFERNYFIICTVIIGLKLALAYFIPITADEAYFWVWGQHLDINYYDHPPVTGWVVALFSQLGRHIFFSRLFTVLSGAALAWGIYLLAAQAFDCPRKARLISLAFLVSPLHVLFVLITTDSPVFLLVFFSGVTFYHSLRHRNRALMILAGALCGLAILGKYFAGLLAIAFIGSLAYRKDKQFIANAALLLAGALPFVLFHLYGNYATCWTNVLFNVFNRNREASWEFSGLLVFIAFQIYLATPWVLVAIGKKWNTIVTDMNSNGNVFPLLFLIPIAIFGIVSFHDTGLHWTLAFIPLLYPLLVHVHRQSLVRIVACSLIFSMLHLLIIGIALALPISVVKDRWFYNDVVMAYHGPEIYQLIKDRYGSDYTLATNGYYTSSAMTYHSGEHFIVFLDDSKHGRYDDKLTDYRLLDGETIISLRTLPVDEDYSPFFETVRIDELTVAGGTFYIVIGKNFNYRAYRDLFLKKIRNRLYAIPDYLPVGRCYFFEMYFDEE
jgi:4-amino-4-deoxy-L-arabinose transferase-like glycosyltransferase